MKIFFYIFLSAAFTSVSMRAQDNVLFDQRAELLFKQAVINFEMRNYIAASVMFSQTEKDFPLNQRTTAAIIMQAKALFKLEKFDSSIQVLGSFLRRFPASTYLDDAHFMLGQNYYVQHRYTEVVPEMLFVVENSEDTILIDHARSLLVATAQSHLPIDVVRSLYTEAKTQPVIAATGIVLAQKYARGGEFVKATDLLKSLALRYPDDRLLLEMDSLLILYEKGIRIKIGLLLPLLANVSQSSGSEIASNILEGAEFAASEFNRTSNVVVAVDPRDTQRDSLKIIKDIEELANDPEVIGVIGPVFSDEVEIAARAAVRHALPLVTPTATANGLTRAGKEVFQANPDYMIRGSLMAQFAVDRLGLKTFAVLHSAEEFSTRMAEAFIKEVKQRGAQVIVSDSYKRGGEDLQQQMTTIRNQSLSMQHEPTVTFSSKMKRSDLLKFLKAGVSQTLIDSLVDRNATITVGTILGRAWKIIVDSLRLPVTRSLVDTIALQTPAEGIEALYAPIASPNEIGIIGAQLAYYNIHTQLLGSGDWYQIDELDANSRYVNGVYFDADCYLSRDDSAYAKFADSFEKATGRTPTKNAVIGYDAMKMMMSLMQEGKIKRSEFLQKFSTLKQYNALHSIISFTRDRVNGALTILQYKNGRIEKIGHEFWKGEPHNESK